MPLVRGLLTTRYVRGMGTRTDRGWVDGKRTVGEDEREGERRPWRESDARSMVGLQRCWLLAAPAAVMDLAHYWL